MKHLQNKLLQLFFMCVMVLTIWGFTNPVMKVQAENTAPDCGELTNWVALPQSGGQLNAGNYYLSNDVTLLNNITISSGTINLNLNSNILTGAFGSNQSIFTVTNGTLNIYDCSAVKKVHNYKIKTVQGDLTQDTYANQPAYSNKLFQRFYDFNEVGDGIIEGGIITGGHKFSASSDLKSNFNYAGGGSAILIGNSGGVVNFYGGTLSGNTTTALSQWGGKRERSGTVGVMDGGTFNFYQGQIVGNSSRYGGAGIYLFGSSYMPARVNIYGGIIEDNYSHDTAYNFQNTSSMFTGGGGISTDNVGNGASILSLSGSPKIINNKAYDFASNQYISTNLNYSTESVNSIKILDKLYTEQAGVKTYASIGLWGGAGEQLTSNYTLNGNTHEDVNKIFFSDNPAQAVAYNTSNGELRYVVSNLNTLTYHANNGLLQTSSISVVDKISISTNMFSKTGHVFSHWNTIADDTGLRYEPDDILTLTNNQALYAIWTPATYTLSYQTNGGKFNAGVPQSYTYSTTQALPIPVWTGKTFEGWFDNALLTGSPLTQIEETTVGNLTLYAKWSGVSQHTITSAAGLNGSIYPSGSIIYNGTSQDYWIIPANGYKISTFTVDGVDKLTAISNNKYVVSGVTSDVNIEVTFEKIATTDITVFASSGQQGSITPNGFSVAGIGQSITYYMTPNPGYRISDVKVNGVSVGAVSSYTLSNITSTQSIIVEFSPLNTIIQSPVSFNLNGGQFMGIYVLPSTYTEGLGLQLPSASELSKANHTFAGWFDNESLNGSPSTYIALTDTGEQTYWAKWVKDSTIITFESNGGDAVAAIQQVEGTNIDAPNPPTKIGYTFAGWYSDSGLTTAYVFNTMPAESMTLYAKWTINSYSIQFDSNGGSAVTTITQNFDTVVTKPADPTKLGYTFAGWYSDSGLTTAYVFNKMSAESITLYAKWTVNAYNIQFESNGGSAVKTITQNFDSAVTKPVDPTKLGYTFGGWYSDSTLTTAYVFNTMPAVDITLYAKWSINAYNIQFESNGGSVVSTITQNFDSAVTKPVDPTKLGHTFGGWYSNSDLTTAYVFNTMPAADITLYAKWTINSYSIHFESNGGSAVTTITQNFDTVVTKPVDPTKLGHKFGGWYSDSDLTTAFFFNTMPAADITLYAKWSINAYNIQFESNGGSVVSTITQNFDTVVTKPVDSTKLGYTFGGWYSDSDLTTAYVFNTMPADSITLYAKWTVNAYNIQFESNGGSAVPTITQNFDTVVTKPANPTKLGHTFGGWYSNSDLTTAYVFNTMPAADITLYAKWSINAYNIHFESNGGSVVSTITQNFDTVVTKPVDPTKLGHTFGGWYSDSGLTTAYVFNKMSAESITLYAKWTINSYSIHFESNGGSAVTTITQNFDTVVTKPADPTKLGHTFGGWYSNSALTTAYVFNTMPAVDITLYAKWTLNTYTITFDTKGGTVIQTVSLEFGETIVQPYNPTKTGFIFNGWNQGLPTVMPAESIILVAYWLKASDTSSEHGSSNSQDLINAIDPALIVGKDVEVSIVFERKLTTTISETVKSSIESLLKQNQKYAIMDIRVILKAQGQSDIEINELNETISITLVLSKAEQGHKNYQIIAVHNGQARVIESEYDAEQKTITFETDQFSTFAIVYQTNSQQWGWWFLTLLIPIGFVAYKYRNNWLSLISKKEN